MKTKTRKSAKGAGAKCPECGMEKSEWPNKSGHEKEGMTYCCQGCAEGTGCTCE